MAALICFRRILVKSDKKKILRKIFSTIQMVDESTKYFYNIVESSTI